MRRLAALVVLLSLTAGCDTSNYAFRVDKSIKILTPKARTEVTLPVRVTWTDSRPPENLRVAPDDPDANYYAVFVDDSPLGPGKRLTTLLPENTPCDLSAGCPTPEQLADAGAYLTAETSIELEFIPDLRPTSRGNTKDTHDVTIVRMRGDKRIGEAAFRQTFFVRR